MKSDLDTDIRTLIDVAEPVSAAEAVAFAAASRPGEVSLAVPARRRVSRRMRRVGAAGILVAALVEVVVFQALPSPETAPSVASAAPFLRQAAHAVLTAPTFSEQSAVVPQENQYVYSETEDPSGTLYQEWLSTNGDRPAVVRYVSSSGEVVPPGVMSNPPCTAAQSGQSGCVSVAGYLPDLPTDSTALLAYLNQIGVTDTNLADANTPGWVDNDLAKGVMYLMQSCYLLPAQQSAVFTLMSQTAGFTIVPNMADAIGRVGVGVEWNFEGDSGALIFNPTTYALLGVRTWPGPPDVNAPYDGDALLGISIVDSTPSTQTPPAS
jgi:hypothetical protein